MRIGSNKGSEVEAYTDFIKEAEGLKSTLRTAWTAEGRQESTAEHRKGKLYSGYAVFCQKERKGRCPGCGRNTVRALPRKPDL